MGATSLKAEQNFGWLGQSWGDYTGFSWVGSLALRFPLARITRKRFVSIQSAKDSMEIRSIAGLDSRKLR